MKRFVCVFICLIILLFDIFGQNISLVSDINRDSSGCSSNPKDFIEYSGKLFFTANDRIHGKEIWEYDGINNPKLFNDLNAGECNSGYSHKKFVFNDCLYFNANNGNENCLWLLNAKNELKQITQPGFDGKTSRSFELFFEFKDKLFFSTSYANSYNGKLWLLNNNDSITLITEYFDVETNGYCIYNGNLYFSAGNLETFGHELCVYDGENDPTMIADLNPGSISSGSSNFCLFKNKMYFSAWNNNKAELWVYDGIKAPELVEQVCNTDIGKFPQNLTVYSDKLYFTTASDKLCIYDGLTSYYELSELDNVRSLVILNNKLYCNDRKGISEIGDTTKLIWEGSNYEKLTEFNNKLYFNTYEPRGYYCFDLNNDPIKINDFNVLESYIYNNKLYFSGNNGYGEELFVYDGTQAPYMVFDIYKGSAHSNPSHFTKHNNKMFFFCDYPKPYNEWGYHKRELWSINHNSQLNLEDTCGISHYWVGGDGWGSYQMPYMLQSLGDELIYFKNYHVSSKDSLTISKLLGNESIETFGFGEDVFDHNPIPFAVIDDKLYYSDYAKNSWNKQIWVYEPAKFPVVAPEFESMQFDGIGKPVWYKDYMYFIITDSEGKGQIIRWTGNESYETLTAINSNAFSSENNFQIIIFNDKLYFLFRSHEDGYEGVRLWCYNFEDDPYMVPTNSNSHENISELTIYKNKLYFFEEYNNKLKEYDGSNTPKVLADSYQGYNFYTEGISFQFKHIIVFNDSLFFSGFDKDHGTELWVYDGENEAKLFHDFFINGHSFPSNYYVFDNKLFFSVRDGYHGNELWVYDPEGKTAIKTNKESKLKVFPNPTNQILNIQLTNLASKFLNLKIYNLTGQQILTQTICSANQTIDVSNLEKGYYIISVSDKAGNTVGSQSVVIY